MLFVFVYVVVTSTLQFRSELRVLLVGRNELIVCDVMDVRRRRGYKRTRYILILIGNNWQLPI